MTEATNIRAAVLDIYAAYERRDFARVAAALHDEIDWICYGPVHIFPFLGARRGKRAVLETMAEIARLYAFEQYRPEIVLVDGDRAAVLSDVGLRQRASGRLLRFRLANFLRLRDGQVIEFRELSNSFDAVEQALGRELDVSPLGQS